MPDGPDRLDAVRDALDAYVRRHGPSGGRQFEIIDLVADLLHLADREGFEARAVVAKAELHVRAEAAQRRLAA
jgi:hypothetical protein